MSITNTRFPLIKASISKEGKVSISTVPGRLTTMPGYKTAIREDKDGSLFSVDLVTGEEELLLQGVPDGLTPGLERATYEVFQKYGPCADDVGYDGKDAGGRPLSITLPIDETSF